MDVNNVSHILTWAQRKTIIQTQFVSVVSKVISDGIFSEHFLKIKNVGKNKKLVPWGTDGRLPLSDLDLDLGSGHTAYRRASLIDLYLRTKFH